MNMLKGQVFLRETNQCSPAGKKLMMFVGMMEVSESYSERMCDFLGWDDGDAITLDIKLPGKDMSSDKTTCGEALGNLILRPIWRV